MNCTEIRLLLHADADGELDAANSVELERHLKTCSGCAAEKKALHSLKAALRQAPLRYEAPDALLKEARRIARGSGREIFSLWRSLPLWRWLTVGATALAMLAILVRPAGISEQDEFLNEAVATHVRSLMVEHLTDVASTDQHTVKPWFNGKLDFAPEVKDFATQGFPLVGGRLDYLGGRRVAALIYRHDKHLINVFVWTEPSDKKLGPPTANRRGYCVINRDTNGLRYCFVSDLNEKDLTKLAKLFGQ